MKTWKILKWCHYSNFLPSILRAGDKNPIRRLEKFVQFTDSCRYEINEPSCVNKLFGFCFGLFGVHKDSVRFGWTYEKETDTIVIWKYIYEDGSLIKYPISSVQIGQKCRFQLECTYFGENNYRVVCRMNDKWVDSYWFTTKHNWLFTLGPYFGGHTRAPHTMHINYR